MVHLCGTPRGRYRRRIDYDYRGSTTYGFGCYHESRQVDPGWSETTCEAAQPELAIRLRHTRGVDTHTNTNGRIPLRAEIPILYLRPWIYDKCGDLPDAVWVLSTSFNYENTLRRKTEA